MNINENSRTFAFSIRRRQTLGSDGSIEWKIGMSHDYKSFRVAFWEVLVSGLWQNHGTSAGGVCPVSSPLSSNPQLPAVVPTSSVPPQSLLIRPKGLMERSRCGSEETHNSSEGVFLGGVMLHSDQSFQGTPEQPGSTVGTGPSDKKTNNVLVSL